MNTGKIDLTVETVPGAELLEAVRTALSRGDLDGAVDQFSDQFTFNDQALELEFTDKARLTQFFAKARELFPDYVVLTDTIFISGDHLISEWTLRATVTEGLLPQGSFKEALRRVENAEGGESPDMANLLNDLAEIEQQRQNFAEGLALTERARSLAGGGGYDDHGSPPKSRA
jgi:hypothetical protein